MPQGDHEVPQRAANGLVCLLLPRSAVVREGTSCRLHAHFPKCRHRPDPAARSGDLCEEPVTFRGSRSAPSVTVAMSLIEEVRFASDSPLDGFEPSVPRQKDNAFRDSSFPTCARATAALRKRSPPRPAAASSSCRSRSDERRTHSPTRRSSGPPHRRHHHPIAFNHRVVLLPCPLHLLLLRLRRFL